MKKYNIKNTAIILLILSLASCKKSDNKSRVENLPYYSEASFTPHWFAQNSDSLKDFHKIPDFSLIDQNGDSITQKTLLNKIVIVDFFFAKCTGICPTMAANMKLIDSEFSKDDGVAILSHSVTPEADTVPVLKEYAKTKGITSPNWHLLTGDKKQIYNLGRKSYFVEETLGEKKTDLDFLHTENYVLIDKNRHIRGIYNGMNKTSVKELVEDIKTLKKEL
ncbi:SCO family protein [Frigoriflavimonas asaccharolytica]|uniref:Protein SCO1/2 n=1 Tax=Frigoriflavimonas asaccharolytica TaxID=2735899 RepID=A0A8J8K819_9FLAO|nr:SCO family protein [Frigoriflavimonas asaccharolytica]NRS92101.1 protein SCO1/2 [Frigoriflavimonas asaccharolytica]